MQLHSAHYMVTLCERILKSKKVKKLLLNKDANSKKQSIVLYNISSPMPIRRIDGTTFRFKTL